MGHPMQSNVMNRCSKYQQDISTSFISYGVYSSHSAVGKRVGLGNFERAG